MRDAYIHQPTDPGIAMISRMGGHGPKCPTERPSTHPSRPPGCHPRGSTPWQRLAKLTLLPLVVLTSLGAQATQALPAKAECLRSSAAVTDTAATCRGFSGQGPTDLMAPIELREVERIPWSGLSAIPETSAPEDNSRDLDQLERRVRPLSDRAPVIPAERLPFTVLRGESIFGLELINNLTRIDGEDSNGANAYFGYRQRLNIVTSFYGEDQLLIRLQSRTIPELEDITGSPLTNLAFDGDSFGIVELSDLWYRFRIGRKTEVNISAIGASLRDNVPRINPLFTGSSRGSISVFGSEDPIVRSRSGASLGISHDITKSLNISAAAISSRADNTLYGIFSKRNAQIVQLTYSPSKTLRMAIAATRSLNDGLLSGEFTDSENVLGTSFSGEIFYQVTDRFAIGLRGGLTETTALDLPGMPRKLIDSYAFLIGFPNLFGKNNLLGFVLGRPPAITYDQIDNTPDTESGHLEMFYRYTISDYLSITPGVMFIISPNDFGGSEQYWIGAVRMTFRF